MPDFQCDDSFTMWDFEAAVDLLVRVGPENLCLHTVIEMKFD